ncbi:hypothetical protein [Vibrio metoecus]|uniref:hypothetical protein n=1 Tax=Vibrio metoecus TaxID=1481663 RepID=UPI000BA92567|nr:hypothetical protein [Vibrio metoecus]PAR42548.1 hypothetical protein CGT95_18330 [Vibrio metoecus]
MKKTTKDSKRFSSRTQFKRWLKKALNILLISISVSGSTTQLHTNIKSTQTLYQSISEARFDLPKGHYLVDFERLENDEVEVKKPRYVFAVSTQENYVGGAQSGDIEALTKDLEGFEYVINHNIKHPGYQMMSLLAIQPDEIQELESLVSTLKKHCRFVAVDDGSGEMHLANAFIGRNELVRNST